MSGISAPTGSSRSGAICGGGLALAFPDAPGWLLFPAMMMLGTIGGMASGGLVAWLRIRFNANEILTSLMLTYITQYLLLYLVTGPWRDPQGLAFRRPRCSPTPPRGRG
jgi:ABC-type uncharacterized transport system permease subunit